MKDISNAELWQELLKRYDVWEIVYILAMFCKTYGSLFFSAKLLMTAFQYSEYKNDNTVGNWNRINKEINERRLDIRVYNG